jgi:hypothetical protein
VAKNRNLWVVEENTEKVDFTVKLSGVPYDITGMIVEFGVRNSVKVPVADAVVLSSTDPAEIALTAPATGRGTVFLPTWMTEVVAGGPRAYRLDLIAGSDRTTLVYGLLLVRDT